MKMARFAFFSDDELYMMKRHAMEASGEIVMSGKYTKEEIALHTALLNEILMELNRRGI